MSFVSIWLAIGIITALLMFALDILTGKKIPVWSALFISFMTVFGPLFTVYTISILLYLVKNRKEDL